MEVIFTDNAPQALSELDDAIESALLAVGQQCEGYAKSELSNTPKRIDTGLLRNSITYALDGKPAAAGAYHASFGSNKTKKGNRVRASSANAGVVGFGSYGGSAPKTSEPSVFVGTNVEYATYVHDGTQRMAANRFLRNAVTKHASVYQNIIKSHLQKG